MKKSKRRLVERLILYIVYRLQTMNAPISRTRLLCLLYLIDLEHYRRYGRTLTGLEWIKEGEHKTHPQRQRDYQGLS